MYFCLWIHQKQDARYVLYNTSVSDVAGKTLQISQVQNITYKSQRRPWKVGSLFTPFSKRTDWFFFFFFFKQENSELKDRVSSRKPDKWQKLFLQLLVAILPRKMTFSKPITKKSLESRSFWRTTTVYEKPGQTQMSQVDPKDSKWSGVISRTIWYCN